MASIDFRVVGTLSEIEEFEKRISHVFAYKLNRKNYSADGRGKVEEPKPDERIRRYGHFYIYSYDNPDNLYEMWQAEKQQRQELEIQFGEAQQRINQLEAQLNLIPKDAAVLSPRHTNCHTKF